MNNKQTLKCNDGLDDVYASIELASSLPKTKFPTQEHDKHGLMKKFAI